MWKCPKCGRIFEKTGQMHSCSKIPLEEHFKNKDEAKVLFDYLVKTVNKEIGHSEIISLPCCIHLFRQYDFVAILPKKYGLEIRFKTLKNPANVFEIKSVNEIDKKFIDSLKQASLYRA